MKILLSFQKISEKSNSEWIFLVSIQLLIAAFFVFMVRYFCKQLKIKDPEKPVKKTCILISFLSAIAWFIIAQIVWVITSIQMWGN
ncbi:MAG: hypothetical protein WAR79_19775 [Melioribacteraceae bacterium]